MMKSVIAVLDSHSILKKVVYHLCIFLQAGFNNNIKTTKNMSVKVESFGFMPDGREAKLIFRLKYGQNLKHIEK